LFEGQNIFPRKVFFQLVSSIFSFTFFFCHAFKSSLKFWHCETHGSFWIKSTVSQYIG